MVGYSDDGHVYFLMYPHTLRVRTEGIVDFIEHNFPGSNIDWESISPASDDDNYNEPTDAEENDKDDEEDDEEDEEEDEDEQEERDPESYAPRRRSSRRR